MPLTEPTYVGPDRTDVDDVIVQAGAMGQEGWKTRLPGTYSNLTMKVESVGLTIFGPENHFCGHLKADIYDKSI